MKMLTKMIFRLMMLTCKVSIQQWLGPPIEDMDAKLSEFTGCHPTNFDGLSTFENFASVVVAQRVQRFTSFGFETVNESLSCGFEKRFLVRRHNNSFPRT
jgi:hypothetical protein